MSLLLPRVATAASDEEKLGLCLNALNKCDKEVRLLQLQTVQNGELQDKTEAQRDAAIKAAEGVHVPVFSYLLIGVGMVGTAYGCATQGKEVCTGLMTFTMGAAASLAVYEW